MLVKSDIKELNILKFLNLWINILEKPGQDRYRHTQCAAGERSHHQFGSGADGASHADALLQPRTRPGGTRFDPPACNAIESGSIGVERERLHPCQPGETGRRSATPFRAS